MARSLNMVQIIGNLTRDPEMRYTPKGSAVTTFGVATNRQWVTEGETREEAEFHNVVAWNKLAELCSQLLKKGNKVYICGRLRTRNWDDAQGVRHYKTEIIADDMIVLTRPAGEVAVGAPKSEVVAAPSETPRQTPPSGEGASEEVTEEDAKGMPF